MVTASAGDFFVGGTSRKALTVLRGQTYTFNVGDSSNSTHVFRFSITADGTHGGGVLYTTGVSSANNPGTAGATSSAYRCYCFLVSLHLTPHYFHRYLLFYRSYHIY